MTKRRFQEWEGEKLIYVEPTQVCRSFGHEIQGRGRSGPPRM